DAADREAAVAGAESAGEELVAERRLGDGQAIDFADDELAVAAAGHEGAESPDGRGRDVRVIGRRQGLEGRSAALQVEGRDPIDEHDVSARRALQWPAIGVSATRPW